MNRDQTSDNNKAVEVINSVKSLLGASLLRSDERRLELAAYDQRVPMKDAQKLRAWMMARFPGIYAKLEGMSPRGGLRMLLDENLPYQVAPSLYEYGYISSVLLEGWVGKKDKFIYPYSYLKGQFDTILTRDTALKPSRALAGDPDLTDVALQKWGEAIRKGGVDTNIRFPTLLHFPTLHPYRDGSVVSLRKEFNRVSRIIEARSHAIVEVRPSGVYPKKETSRQALWEKAVSYVPYDPSKDGRPPRSVADICKYSEQLAERRNLSVDDLMEEVKERTTRAYDFIRSQNRAPEMDEVLGILDTVLSRVKPGMEEEALLVVEMAVRAVRKRASAVKESASESVPQVA